VFHVTDRGREEARAGEKKPRKSRGRVVGPVPDTTKLHGREEIVSSISSGLSEGSSYLLEGLPGIGKTSVATAVSNSLIDDGWLVRWATCQTDSDSSSISRMWLGGRAPTSKDAIVTRVDSKKTLLVLDEAQQSSGRLVEGIREILEACSETSAVILAVTRAPNPFPDISGFESIRLEGLQTELARDLLPLEMDDEQAIEVCEAMDGHPLGIKLWSPDDELPGSGAVQEYVEAQVLRRLSQSGASSLDELSLSPLPLEVEEMLEPGGTEELDESAILRWAGTLVEPHHLVRNVRRASLMDGGAEDIHSKLAEMWSKRAGSRARRMEAHHRLESGTDVDPEWVAKSVNEIVTDDSAAAAVVLQQAISTNPEEALFELAADIALERGEPKIASEYIESMEDGPRRDLRMARLARIEGEWDRADELEASAISGLDPGDRVRAEISSLVRNYDDRLPGSDSRADAQTLLAGADSVRLSDLEEGDRELASLVLDLLRHSLALDSGDLEEASRTRDSIEGRMGAEDPRLLFLDLRSRLSAGAEAEEFLDEALEAARSHIESSTDPLERLRSIHLSLEACSEPPNWLIEAHSSFDPESLGDSLAPHRRAKAHWWFWRGVTNRDDRLSSWKEAIVRLRSTGCGKAARDLTQRLSREL
tara:strand:- start:107 stop:2053 length:1947 start_codon:yes stop_codon:yes gene_type:complete